MAARCDCSSPRANCSRCKCSKAQSCFSCRPLGVGHCLNQLPAASASSSAGSTDHMLGSSSTAPTAPPSGLVVSQSPSPPSVVAPPVNLSTVISTSSVPLSGLDTILKVSSPTLHHVPKAVRPLWATLFSQVINTVVAHPSDYSLWCRLFMLPCCILVFPLSGVTLYWGQLTKLIRVRVKRCTRVI